MMSKRPPLGKLALAGKHNRERQLLDREQRERDRRDLLSLVGKNSSLAVSSSSGQGTPSRNERYAARVASAEKARRSAPPPPRPSSPESIQIFARMVLLTLSRKLYLMEMEIRLNLVLSLLRLMRNPIPVRRMTRRDHLDPLVAERE